MCTNRGFKVCHFCVFTLEGSSNWVMTWSPVLLRCNCLASAQCLYPCHNQTWVWEIDVSTDHAYFFSSFLIFSRIVPDPRRGRWPSAAGAAGLSLKGLVGWVTVVCIHHTTPLRLIDSLCHLSAAFYHFFSFLLEWLWQSVLRIFLTNCSAFISTLNNSGNQLYIKDSFSIHC